MSSNPGARYYISLFDGGFALTKEAETTKDRRDTKRKKIQIESNGIGLPKVALAMEQKIESSQYLPKVFFPEKSFFFFFFFSKKGS